MEARNRSHHKKSETRKGVTIIYKSRKPYPEDEPIPTKQKKQVHLHAETGAKEGIDPQLGRKPKILTERKIYTETEKYRNIQDSSI